jgi:hypothetical protein
MGIIAAIVVAGNIRRSALLAAGSPHDSLYLKAKNWKDSIIPSWREKCNNSVICNDYNELTEKFWAGYLGDGEPYGLINLDLCRSYGRLYDEKNYRPDYGITGTNPCGEIPLEPYEACNLFELFLPNLETTEQLITAATLGYKVCKTISNFPFQNEKVDSVCKRNHRLGIGVTGLLQSDWLERGPDLSKTYTALEEMDKKYSRELGVKESIKLTTIKPSGTLSLLPGVTPGIHPTYARYYIRRIRFSSDDPLIELCKSKGYDVEPVISIDGSRSLDTMVISFPIKAPKSSIIAASVTAVNQLRFQHFAQIFWADNSVSTTCYYHKEELPAIKDYLRKYYNDNIKTVSFCLHSEHGFLQAPYEEITEQQYKEMSKGQKPITRLIDSVERELTDNLECASGSCPIR